MIWLFGLPSLDINEMQCNEEGGPVISIVSRGLIKNISQLNTVNNGQI